MPKPQAPVKKQPTDELFSFIPPGCQRYILEWNKTSKKGAITNVDDFNNFNIKTDHEAGNPSCKAMGKNPI